MPETKRVWIIKFVLPFLFFALPSLLIVMKLWLERKRDATASNWSDLPRQTAIFFLVSYLFWSFAVFFPASRSRPDWLSGFVVAWPPLGILLSLIGAGLAFLARENEKTRLLLTNLLFMALSLSSIIAPN
jgi:hypothetical protein